MMLGGLGSASSALALAAAAAADHCLRTAAGLTRVPSLRSGAVWRSTALTRACGPMICSVSAASADSQALSSLQQGCLDFGLQSLACSCLGSACLLQSELGRQGSIFPVAGDMTEHDMVYLLRGEFSKL